MMSNSHLLTDAKRIEVIDGIGTLAKRLLVGADMLLKDADARASSDPLPLIETLVAVNEAYEAMRETKRALDNAYDRYSIQLIPDAMREKRMKTVNLEGIGRITVSYRFSCSMLDKDQGYEWLQNNGLGELIKPTVNSSALSSAAKARIENEGKDMPLDIFKVSSTPYTSITRTKG
jgi:hypothetical protein